MVSSNVNKYISYLSNNRINKFSLITEVLSVFTFDELNAFRSKVSAVYRGLASLSYLKRKSYSDIFTKGRMLWPDSTDLYGALAYIIISNSKDINHYIQLKEELDNATAISDYKESYRLLTQIDKEVSASMMGTYYLLKLTRLDKGITASTQLHNDICKKNNVLSYFANVAFKSASIDLPFEAELEGKYRSLRGEEEVCDFFTAFAYPFKNTKGYKWLRYLTSTSLIDLYEGFVYQLSCLTPEDLNTDHIKRYLIELSHNIKDVRIQKFCSFINKDKSLVYFSDYSEERELIERYYSKDYEYVYSKGHDYLKQNPLEATILDIFSKSCLQLDRFPEDVFPEESLATRLHNFYVMSLSNDDISEACRTQLKSMCIAWYIIPSLRQIYHAFTDIERIRKGSVYRNYWRYSLLPEIREASFYSTVQDAIEYLRGSGYADDSTQIKILENRGDDSFNQSYRLLYGFSDEEIPTYCNELEEDKHTPFITGCITSQLFDRLMEKGEYADAISLYVRCRLRNSYVKINVDKPAIGRALTDAEDDKIENQLELAVFYTMIGAEVYKRYLAYKRYLKKSHLRRASDIEDLSSPIIQYFVGKVAARNVLTLHVLEFDKDEDVTNERIELCKRMLQATGEKAYSDEITTLIKEQEVLTLAQQVNDSKIHVDVQSLINSGLSNEKILFDTYSDIDENLEMYEQKNIEGLVEYIRKQYEGQNVWVEYELPSVKYKRVIFRQMVLSIRDKFLFDPIYGLDKYLSARIRHGTLITQLRNHFLSHSLVTNKKEGGDYQRINPWTQRRYATLTDDTKEAINERMLQFTIWLDEQLKDVKDEKIQIRTERNDGKESGLFDYSESLMGGMIDKLESNNYDSFEAFVYSTIDLLWKWTNYVLEVIREYFQRYEEMVVEEMTRLQTDVVSLMGNETMLINNFKDTITRCRTDFQSDISVVTSWFKPEKSNVRFFTIQQAVDTSLSVINKINQNALSFSNITINDEDKYNGDYFNAIHDIFHDMMNNILGYESKRPALRGKGKILISSSNDRLCIEVSNPIDIGDVEGLKKMVAEQKSNIPVLIAGGKTRRESNSGCVKIYSTVMYTLGFGNKYENRVEDDCFVARIELNTKKLKFHEDTIS